MLLTKTKGENWYKFFIFTIMNNFHDLKMVVASTGYVGLSMTTLLSQNHRVTAVDVIPENVEKINIFFGEIFFI